MPGFIFDYFRHTCHNNMRIHGQDEDLYVHCTQCGALVITAVIVVHSFLAKDVLYMIEIPKFASK